MARWKPDDGLTPDQRYSKRHPEKRAAQQKVYRERDPEKTKARHAANYRNRADTVREYNLKRWYGIDKAQFDAMHAAQGGKCAICLADFSEFTKGACVDHDHETGMVRSLLCSPCNIRVGIVENEGKWRDSVLAYLTLHRK